MGSETNISVSRAKIARFCVEHHIHKLSFFGSVLRDDFKPSSDIDVLVEFEAGYLVGFVKFVKMEEELSEILGHTVDLHTPADLSRYFRDDVCNSAEVQYVQG